MIIEVDTLNTEKNGISTLQYLIGYLLLNREFEKIKEIKSEVGEEILIKILTSLSKSRFIASLKSIKDLDYDNIIIRNKFRVLVDDIKDRDFFDELLEIYPKSVIRPDGTKDYLRSDLKRCRVKYRNITNNRLKKHNEILDALKFEVNIKTKEGTLKFMKRLPKWLMEEGWTLYQERMNDNSSNINTYGTDIE